MESGKPELLFKHKDGSVTVTVHGPRIGFQWTRVEYFRWVPSTKEPGQWERRPADREADQIHLERCVKSVREWFRMREQPPGNRAAKKGSQLSGIS